MTRGEARGLTGLFNWTARKAAEPAAAPAASPDISDAVNTSRVFPRFLAAMAPRSSVVLLDLGPVVGSNISFFGDRVDCKIYVLDFFSDVEASARRGDREGLGAALANQLTQQPGSVDGILCWDLFDFLDRSAGQTLAMRLAALLRPGGVLYAFFGTTPVDLRSYTRFVVESDDVLRQRLSPATPTRRQVLHPRDVVKMFGSLVVAESVLLKSNTRETLLRRPAV